MTDTVTHSYMGLRQRMVQCFNAAQEIQGSNHGRGGWVGGQPIMRWVGAKMCALALPVISKHAWLLNAS